MKKFKIILLCFTMIVVLFSMFNKLEKDGEKKVQKKEANELNVLVIKKENDIVSFLDNENIIYTFNLDSDLNVGDNVLIKYDGKLNKNKEYQDVLLKDYKVLDDKLGYLNNGIFKEYYKKIYDKLKDMTLEEKISQILLVRYPDDGMEVLKENQFGGYVFFAKDFENKTYEEVKTMINDLQKVSKIPILTAVDEEGGKVVRISSNSNLANEPFKSSRELYLEGEFEAIKKDTINKSKLLFDLGINLNLAPVVDVSTNSNDYMYERTIGENSKITSQYSKVVIKASKGLGVSYTLKHFPGYGNNLDTHDGKVIDNRSYEDILKNDLPPFKAGIKEGAEVVLVSHNIVSSIDPNNPASLSASIHNLLRNELGFTGIIITDDLAMGATNNIENATVKAILSGNDMIITTDYDGSIKSIKEALTNKVIDESLIDRLAFRIIAWKYYKKML